MTDWALADIADAWLIATAAIKGYVVVTFEKSNGNLNRKFLSSRALIPDICQF